MDQIDWARVRCGSEQSLAEAKLRRRSSIRMESSAVWRELGRLAIDLAVVDDLEGPDTHLLAADGIGWVMAVAGLTVQVQPVDGDAG